MVVLFVLVLVSQKLQVEARKFNLEVKNEKSDSQTSYNIEPGRKLDAVSNGAIVDSEPLVAVKNDNEGNISGTDDSSDEVNHSYKNYGNPSGSSTDSHHIYTDDCGPKKSC